MAFETAQIRQFLLEACSDEEITSLCFDYFRDVYDDFAQGMSKGQKIQRLLDYCEKRDVTSKLIAALHAARPEQYAGQFPDATIEPVSAPHKRERDPRQIFLSHAHQDAEFAHHLAGDLAAQGWKTWIAPESIRAGEKWVEAIQRGLDECGVFVTVLTPNAINSRWVETETNAAIELEHHNRIRFIPIELRNCDLPTLWARYQSVDFKTDYASGLSNLLAALQGLSQIKAGASAPRRSISLGAIILGVVAVLACVAAWLVVPEFRQILGLDRLTPTSIAVNPTDTPTSTPQSTPTPTDTLLPTVTPKILPTATPAIFPQPYVTEIITGSELPGYSKQASITRGAQGDLTLFIRNDARELGFTRSLDQGKTWSKPDIFDRLPPPDNVQVSAAIDSADRVQVVWGPAPHAGNAQYGLLDGDQWIMTATVGTGVFARDIAVDSANHPHIVWTNIDLFHAAFNGQKWLSPEKLASGAWHPDIQINANDDVLLFMNDGSFYPQPGVSVYEMDNSSGRWKATKVSTSPFWSGGAVAALDSSGNIYLLWMGASSESGGLDQVFFSRYIGGEWQTPFPIGDVNTSAGSTGQESPAIAFDANDVLYVFWRGLNTKNRPVIFARAYASESSKVSRVTSGWSPVIEIDDRNASGVGWPSVADMYYRNRGIGVDLVWGETVGKNPVIAYSKVTYP